MGRVALIGDVGGHATPLEDVLGRLGVRDGVWPDDMTVIQVGDLVDRGPESHRVVAIVRQHLEDSPGRWLQLAGNHEAQYLPAGTPFWRDPIPGDDRITLQQWWESGVMRVATAVRTADDEDSLVTHAGLTVGAWRGLGEPTTAAAAARLLNERPAPIWDLDGGPFWAEAGRELHEPWMEFYAEGGFVPFGQIHGHSTVVDYASRSWHCAGRVRQRASVDWAARHTRVRVGGREFIAIDPKHGRSGAESWAALVLDGAVVLTSPSPHPLGA